MKPTLKSKPWKKRFIVTVGCCWMCDEGPIMGVFKSFKSAQNFIDKYLEKKTAQCKLQHAANIHQVENGKKVKVEFIQHEHNRSSIYEQRKSSASSHSGNGKKSKVRSKTSIRSKRGTDNRAQHKTPKTVPKKPSLNP